MNASKHPTFTFRMVFRGLCLFVPNDDYSAYTVLLPNAWPDADIQPQQQECDTHHPLLTFKLKNLCSNLDPEVGDADGFFQLRRHDVNLGVASKKMAAAKLGSVPNIDTIYPGCKGVNKIHVKNPGLLVVARIQLHRGKLYVHDNFAFNGEEVSAHFVPLPKDGSYKPGPLASKVALEIGGLTDHIDVIFKVFKKPAKTTLRLRPVKNKHGDLENVEVGVQNVCGEQVIERGATRVDLPRQDPDFAWHYMFTNEHPGYPYTALSAMVPVPLPQPFAYAMSPSSGQGGGLPVRCGPAQSNPPVTMARSGKRRIHRSEKEGK